jgi:hypothetical protein
MAQIQSPETFADGQQVTAARLNNMVSGAALLPGAVTDQTALSGGVESGDFLLVHDASTSSLRKATAAELLNSALPVVTNSISSTSGNGVQVATSNATVVAGSSYVSADGQSVTVTTPSAHGLNAGDIVAITLAGTGYNGTFAVFSASGSTFVYNLFTSATAGSGFLSYEKQGTLQVAGNTSATGRVFSNGITSNSSLFVATTSRFNGPVTLSSVTDGFSVITGNVTATTAPTVAGHLANKAYVDGQLITGNLGYARLPGGLIIQWGRTTSMNPLTTQVQTFSIPFPSACINVQATKITSGDYFGDRKDTHAVLAFTTTTFTMFNQHEMGTATYNWLAIGY